MARSQVYDDQEDYFTLAQSSWLSEGERQRAAEAEESRRESLHKRSSTVRVSFDIAGRRVTVAGGDKEEEEGAAGPIFDSDQPAPTVVDERPLLFDPNEDADDGGPRPSLVNHTLTGKAAEVYTALRARMAQAQAQARRRKEEGEEGDQGGSALLGRLQHGADADVFADAIGQAEAEAMEAVAAAGGRGGGSGAATAGAGTGGQAVGSSA